MSVRIPTKALQRGRNGEFFDRDLEKEMPLKLCL
jgi:hypothetical protein